MTEYFGASMRKSLCTAIVVAGVTLCSEPSAQAQKASPEGDATDNSSGWHFILRDKFSDISIFSDPSNASDAKGAQLSWTNDAIAQNKSWAATGVTGMAYTWTAPENPVGAYIAGFAIAPTLLFNRVTNSNAKLASKEVNLLQYALTSELGIGHVLGGTQYFRLRGGFLSDFDGTAKSWAATAEWQPVSTPAGLAFRVFFGALIRVRAHGPAGVRKDV